ncbi:nitroreductase/quinone reductase family protein [Actinoplanes sp. NPDC051851]|uniref:nitroreductase/quinone reductase family protein n=1 Tax=Actinoplanes sp. NPDC051851 TaxID=3154753 RepID=UPI003429C7FF
MPGDTRPVRVPPRWFAHAAWRVHRAVYTVTGGRIGLWRPGQTKWGAFRLTVVGRRSGKARSVILAYFEDGPNVVTLAMNGWGEGHPAWWLNLQAHPEAEATIAGATRAVRGRAAEPGPEHDRLWARWQTFDRDLDAYVTQRRTDTPVVILEPRR